MRFRHEIGEAHDFLAVTELRVGESILHMDVKCHVMICARDTSLRVVAKNYSRFRPEVMDKKTASNGMINLQVIIETVQEGTMFFIRTVPLDSPPEITYNATVELQIFDASTEMIVLNEDETAIQSEATTIKRAVHAAEENFKQTTRELELVTRELSEMEAKKAQLVMRCKALGEEVDSLEDAQKTAMARLDRLAERRLSTQQRLESLSNKAAPIILTGNDGNGSEAESELPILGWAVLNGNLGCVRRLLDMGEVDIEIRSGPNERIPLHFAAFQGHHEIALMLIEHGAKVNCRDKFGKTPLHRALWAKDEQVVSLLVEKSANINLQDIDGRQSLHLAAEYGMDFAVGLFLEKGVEIEAVDKHSSTALHNTADNGSNSVVDVLTKKGAVVNARNRTSQMPLHLAVLNGHETISELLIKYSADVNAKDEFAQTLLHYMCYHGHLAVARLLVQEGANIDARTTSRATPLNVAVNRKHRDIAELLVAMGASMVSNIDGLLPLHWAASWGNEAILKILLNTGSAAVVLNKSSKLGKSPLDCALTNNHKGAAKLLSSYGAIKSSERSKIFQSSEPIGNRIAVHSSAVAAEQQSLAAHKQVKPSLSSVFEKALKRGKFI